MRPPQLQSMAAARSWTPSTLSATWAAIAACSCSRRVDSLVTRAVLYCSA